MTMNQDNQSGNQGMGQGDGFSTGGEEFVFTEEKRPVNRNMVVLLLIAVVGGGLVYLMYLRGQSHSSESDAATLEKSQQVAEFMQKGAEDLKVLDQTLQKMEQQVNVITADNGANQVPTGDLKTNPFQFEKQTAEAPIPGAIPEDPKALAARALAKAEIQMITFAARGSTCILNNKLCSEGDQITIEQVSFKVKQIAKDYVVLQSPVGEFKVTMHNTGL